MCKILWIEDDTATTRAGAMALTRVARNAGVSLSIEAAPTLLDARMRAHTADCILLDLDLPDSTAIETAAKLESLTKDWPPVIVLSNFVNPDDPEAGGEGMRGLYWRVILRGAANVYCKEEAFNNPALILDAVRKAILQRMARNRRRQSRQSHAA